MIAKRACTLSIIINNGVIKHIYSETVNNKLLELYPYGKYSLNETYEKILNIYEICPICGEKIYLFKYDKKCKYNATILNNKGYWIDKNDEDCNENEKMHKKFRLLSQKLHNFKNNKYLNNNIKNFMDKWYPFDFEKYNFKYLYEKFINFYYLCPICNCKIYPFIDTICKNIGTIPLKDGSFIEKEDKDCNKYELKHKYFRKESKNIEAAMNTLIELRKNLEWNERQNTINNNNLKIAREKQLWLRENDIEWSNRNKEQCRLMGKKYGPINIKKIKIKKLIDLYEKINSINFKLNNSNVNYFDISKLKENDICGAYLIRGKYKKNGVIYDLLTCKSKNIYNEISWVLRVISQPEKQDKVVTDDNPWTIAKWWYIANLYYDIEFILLTDLNGVSEEKSLLIEAKYAIEHDLVIKFDKKHIPQIDHETGNGKHGYWSL